MTKDEAVAALRRAADMDDCLVYENEWPGPQQTSDAAILRAIADAIERAQINELGWLIPAPRLP